MTLQWFFVGEAMSEIALALFLARGRRLSIRQRLSSIMVWSMYVAAFALLICGELQHDRTLYSAGCVVFWGIPILAWSIRGSSRLCRRTCAALSLTCFLTGFVLTASFVPDADRWHWLNSELCLVASLAHWAILLSVPIAICLLTDEQDHQLVIDTRES
jgi:hypothetical protein